MLLVFLTGCGGCPTNTVDDPDAGGGGGASVSSSRGSVRVSSSGGAISGGGSSGNTGSGGSGSSAGGASSGGPIGESSSRPMGPTVVDLVVTPDPAVLDVPSTGGDLALTVEAILSDGSRRPAQSPFARSESPQIGTMADLTFHATGERNGVAQVRIRAEGAEKRHTITVRVRDVQIVSGAPDGIAGAFSGPVGDASTAPTLAYPLNNVVIPLNLAPMLFQWRSPIADAWYHLRIEGPLGSLDLYSTTNVVSPDAAAWRRLLLANAGSSLTATLESVQSAGGERHVAAQSRIHLANADLTATVYYWALNAGRIVRIDANSQTPTLLDTQPAGTCVACHALSADGQRLAFTYEGGNGPGGVINPSSPTQNVVGPDGNKRWNFAAISPNNNLLISNYQKQLVVRNASGDALTDVQNPVATEAAHPAWSPTGDMIAYASEIANADGNPAPWEVDYERSNLTIRAINPLTGAIGDVIRTLSGNGTNALIYPNFSPGGVWVIYNRAIYSRSMRENTRAPLPAPLEMVDVMGGGNPIVLDNASPAHDGYLATFSPFVEGGYLWVAFFSTRDYGVVLEGQARRQIWVTAIDQNPQPGQDPSHPAFYLPGQDLSTENMSSFFAPVPCVGAGGTCESDLHCCDGNLCRPNGSGQLVCTPPDQACRLPGDACSSDGECCAGAGPCFDDGSGTRTCTPPALQCRMTGQSCGFDDDCCVNAGSCFDNGSGMRVCTPVTNQCRMNGQSCSPSQPCCMGAGDCFTPPGSTESTCKTPDQRCHLPTESCTVDADCCAGTNARCLVNTMTGMKACLTPQNQCRTEAQPCMGDMDCCSPWACLDGACGSIGG